VTRLVRFWLTGPYKSEEITGIRGQAGDSGDDPDLYEIVKEGEQWQCLRWLRLETDPDAHGHKLIFTGDCFACMEAAERDAQTIEEWRQSEPEEEQS